MNGFNYFSWAQVKVYGDNRSEFIYDSGKNRTAEVEKNFTDVIYVHRKFKCQTEAHSMTNLTLFRFLSLSLASSVFWTTINYTTWT